MATYEELMHEAAELAGSPAGMATLIRSLLDARLSAALERELELYIRSYVYKKRCREIHMKRGYMPRVPRFDAYEVLFHRQDVEEVMQRLANEVGWEEARNIRRKIGGKCQGILRDRWITDVVLQGISQPEIAD